VTAATRKIVVIDDSRAIRGFVKDMLPDSNFQVLEAKDGIEGLELIKNENPWLVLLDFILPKLSGFQVYEALQQDPHLARIPLILMSGRKEEVTEKIPEPFDEKFVVFMGKPFDKNQLYDAIKHAVALAQKRPALVTEKVEEAPADKHLEARVKELEQKVEELEKRVALQARQIQQIVQHLKAHPH
jgi:CheY-like chemotaxis protein